MKYRGSYGETFAVCDFCGTDASDRDVIFIRAVGDQGICSKCAKALGEAIDKANRHPL